MYVDIKISLWERIKIPKHLEKDFSKKLLHNEITSPEDAILFLGDQIDDNREKLEDTLQFVKIENNDGEPTMQLFDNRHTLIFSND
jgi:hypothetical protein